MLEINDFNAIRISLASPDEIMKWSHGEVTKPETINYRTLRPERDGLFCEKTFGPTKDWECYCGKYKRVRYKGIVCDKCGVEVTRSKVRRDRMGHIKLASPVSHIWFVKGTPSRLGLLLDISPRNLERVLYFAAYVITDIDDMALNNLREQIQADYQQKRGDLERSQGEQSGEYATTLSKELSELDTALDSAMKAARDQYQQLQYTLEEEANNLREQLEDMIAHNALADEDISFRGITLVEENEPVRERVLEALEQAIEQERERMEQRREHEFENIQVLSESERDQKRSAADAERERILSSLSKQLEDLNKQEKEKVDQLEDIQLHRIISENEYRQLRDLAPYTFKADMGAGAIRDIVALVDLDELSNQLQAEVQTTSGQRRKKATKRLRVVEAFRKSGNRPEWMIMTILPVIPPDLRPMVQLDGGRFATSDLNDLYRRVINRNNRLKRLMELNAPEIIVRNEKRMLQEAVDALIDNGRRGRPVSGKGKHRLKSLSDMLKGKQGRFRQNLLGKRVDYSGRSVIVVGPTLALHQCGLPKKMALELFKPFVMRRLVDKGFAHNIKSAKRYVERVRHEVWDVLEEVIKDYLVLLNRAPSLHRLSIQAFEAKLIEGSAIQLHPLVCAAFNADFDGDQMAVHVPLSRKAQDEARRRMISTYNLLSPANGDPIITPSQDIVLGCYYLTQVRDGAKGSGKRFANLEEALMAHTNGVIHIQAPVWVVVEDNIVSNDRQVRELVSRDGRTPRFLLETSVGRIIFNDALRYRGEPKAGSVTETGQVYHSPLHFRNVLVGKSGLKGIIADCYRFHSQRENVIPGLYQELMERFGPETTEESLLRFYASERTARLADRIKALGFKHATLGGMTFSAADIEVPDSKPQIIQETFERVRDIEKMQRRGLITDEERYREVVTAWLDATDQIKIAVREALNPFGPVSMMATSQARGNIEQIRQMAGMRGLMSDPTGRIIELPITANFREGLTVMEYFISTHGGRKGLADTALRTADAGYLTRRLVDVAQDVIVTIEDCATEEGVWVRRDNMSSVAERVIGRVAAADLVHPETGDIIFERGTEIDELHAELINAAMDGLNKEDQAEFGVFVRSVLNCNSEHGICRLCYGRNLATGMLVEIGEAVGIIAAQSIGEPGTQLTLRTFHTGGIATDTDITQGLPRVQEIFEARVPKGKAILAQIGGRVEILKDDDGGRRLRIVSSEIYSDEVALPANYNVIVQDGSEVQENSVLAESNIDDDDRPALTASMAGKVFVHDDRIVIRAEEREEHEEAISHSARLRAKEGDIVEVGQQLAEGSVDPQEMLQLRGRDSVQEYLVNEAQHVYRSQGVAINDKHIEIIARQMLRRVRIEEPGDTELLHGELIEMNELTRMNAAIVAQGGDPALAQPVLLGITKASLSTDSFLSAASFQETTRVLTEAAVNGKIDYLRGLKENVVIGKLIPAGTGMEHRRMLAEEAARAQLAAAEQKQTTEQTAPAAEASKPQTFDDALSAAKEERRPMTEDERIEQLLARIREEDQRSNETDSGIFSEPQPQSPSDADYLDPSNE